MNKEVFRPTDAASVRVYNRSQVIRLLWQEEAISRAEIARRLLLSRSTVSAIVGELIALGLAEDHGPGRSTGGRRPLILGFRDDTYTLLGVDVAANYVGALLMNLKGQSLGWEKVAFPVVEDPEGTLALMKELCRRVIEGSTTDAEQLAGIGISVPSPVDASHPGSMSSLDFPNWRGYNVIDAVRQVHDVPVSVDNDANLAALAEYWWGEGKSDPELAFIELGAGIGAGHLIDGKIYRGATGIAGEIGHVSIHSEGPQCVCGLKGCLVTYIGAAALLREAQRQDVSMETQDTAGLIKAAYAGDLAAQKVLAESAKHLGVAVASLINLMNPSRVILGGALSRAGDFLLKPLRTALAERVPATSHSEATVTISQLSEEAKALGAATLALDGVMADQSSLRILTPAFEEA